MLEYAKTVLKNVSFSSELFNKELNKLSNWVTAEEGKELQKWCVSKFGYGHNEVVSKNINQHTN